MCLEPDFKVIRVDDRGKFEILKFQHWSFKGEEPIRTPVSARLMGLIQYDLTLDRRLLRRICVPSR